MAATLNGKLDLLLSDVRFETLKRSKLTINSFYLNKSREQDHSTILSWLLDPHQAHGLGDLFIRRLLIECFKKRRADNGDLVSIKGERIDGLALNRVHAHSFGQAIVLTELKAGDGFIDIFVIDPLAELVIVIENKYGAKETTNQLERYTAWANSNFTTYSKVYVVIDANDSIEKRDPWVFLDYSWIADFLTEVIQLEYVHIRVKTLLTDYLRYIQEEYFDEWNKYDRKLLISLYQQHSEIFKNTEVRELISNVLQEWDWSALDKSFSEKEYQMEKLVIYRNKEIFKDLIGIHHLEPIELELLKQDPGCEVEIYKNYVCYLPSKWRHLISKDGLWAAYYKILVHESDCDIELQLRYLFAEESNSAQEFLSSVGKKVKRDKQKSARKVIKCGLPFSDIEGLARSAVQSGRDLIAPLKS